jgi:hypothetical protein
MRYVLALCLAGLLAGLACTGGNADFKCTPICSPGPGGGIDMGGLVTYTVSADSDTAAGSDCVAMAKSDGSACPATYTPVSCTCTE